MRAWKICRQRHVQSTLSGEGARKKGGRWNDPGVAIVYISAHLSLAALEVFVHLDPEDAPGDLAAVPVEIPDDLDIDGFEPAGLPSDGRAEPVPASTRKIGGEWVEAGRTAILRAPSVIVPIEYNYLINPARPAANRILAGSAEPFSFDPRMWKS